MRKRGKKSIAKGFSLVIFWLANILSQEEVLRGYHCISVSIILNN